MNFSKEQIDFIKNASDHVNVLCGGRGYGKTHQLIKEMEDKINKLEKENQQLKKQKDDVVECCKNSIKSINEKLENNKEPFEVVDGKIIYLNDYQVVRLKAIRMKCKEILRMLGEIDER